MENSTEGLLKAHWRNKWKCPQLCPDQALGSGATAGSVSETILLHQDTTQQIGSLPDQAKTREEKGRTSPRRLGCKGTPRINTQKLTSRHPGPPAAKESLSLKSGQMALPSHRLRSKHACFPPAIASCAAVGRKMLLISPDSGWSPSGNTDRVRAGSWRQAQCCSQRLV